MADPALSLRKVTGYAMTRNAPVLQIRELSNYGLYTDSPKAINLGKTGRQLLLDLINLESTSVFDFGRLTIKTPSISNTPGYNSSVLTTASPASGFRGSMLFYYNRVDIKRYFPVSNKQIVIEQNTTTHELIPIINTTYGCSLEAIDIVNQAVSAGTERVLLTAAESSYILKPGTTISIGKLPTISAAVVNRALTGFNRVA